MTPIWTTNLSNTTTVTRLDPDRSLLLRFAPTSITAVLLYDSLSEDECPAEVLCVDSGWRLGAVVQALDTLSRRYGATQGPSTADVADLLRAATGARVTREVEVPQELLDAIFTRERTPEGESWPREEE